MASDPAAPAPDPAPAAQHPMELLRSRSYLVLLVFGAVIGVPVAVIAYYFLKLVALAQKYFFTTLPGELGFHGQPAWWPVPVVAVGGALVAPTLHYLPGTGGHHPAEGFKAGGTITARDLPAIVCAALATLIFGAVLGPEAPLIAIGGGVAVLIVHLIRKDAPDQAILVIGAAGSFAALSTLLVNPLVGAFLLLEAAGVGGGMISVVLAPGLLAAGIGALIFVGLDKLTGFGTFSLAIPHIPAAHTPTGGEFLWAIGIGLAAAVVGTGIRWVGLRVQPAAERRKALIPVLGLAVGGLAAIFEGVAGKGTHQVLFSGQNELPALIQHAGTWSVGALLLVVACKSLAYGFSLGGFRGGPTFPGMFIGAAGGILLSHLPGLPLIDGVGIGIGAMLVVMLGGMPLTAALLTIVFLASDATDLISVVIVAVVVAWVASAHLSRWLPLPALADEAAGAAGTAATAGTAGTVPAPRAGPAAQATPAAHSEQPARGAKETGQGR
jgi:H+/Cl- antiporter ClcA